MTELSRILQDIQSDLQQIYKRLAEVELTGTQVSGGFMPAAGTIYNHLEDDGLAWVSVTDITMADGASIRSPVGVVMTFDDTGNELEISGGDILIDPSSTLTASDGTLHIHTASAGAVTAWSGADDLVVENNAQGGISLLVPDANVSNLVFGTPTASQGSWVAWDYSNLKMRIGPTVASGTLELTSGNNIVRLTAGAGGNLLLAPTATLDLNGIADALILDANANTTISAPTDDQIDFEASGNDIVHINAQGLGIGTPATAGNLHIFDSDDPTIILDTGGTDWYFALDDSDSDSLKWGTGTTVGANVKMTLDTAGNLTIAGGYSPDYAFEKDYDLMSLSNLEQFTIANKHLPHIQSAQHKRDHGLNLSEGYNGLLESIECNVLYLISLEKRIQELESKP